MGKIQVSIEKEHIDFIKENINNMTNRQISDNLGIPIETLRLNINLLKIVRDNEDYFKGFDTPERVNFLRENMGKISLAQILRTLLISKSAIDYILKKNNIEYVRYEKSIKLAKKQSEFFEHDKLGEWYFVGDCK